MKYTKPAMRQISIKEWQAILLRNSSLYRKAFAPGEGKWEDE